MILSDPHQLDRLGQHLVQTVEMIYPGDKCFEAVAILSLSP